MLTHPHSSGNSCLGKKKQQQTYLIDSQNVGNALEGKRLRNTIHKQRVNLSEQDDTIFTKFYICHSVKIEEKYFIKVLIEGHLS